MKEDTPGYHASGLLPILDTQMGVVDGQIVHHHYAKPMASLEVVLKRSAMSMGSKLAILTQEGSRRIRNCSHSLPWEQKVKHINKLMVQMKWAGFGQNQREIVAKRILGKVEMNNWNLEHLGRPLYRSKEERRLKVKDDGEEGDGSLPGKEANRDQEDPEEGDT